MLIALERFALILVAVVTLCTLNFVRGAQVRTPFGQIRKQNLARFALGTSEEDIPLTRNKSTHKLIASDVKQRRLLYRNSYASLNRIFDPSSEMFVRFHCRSARRQGVRFCYVLI